MDRSIIFSNLENVQNKVYNEIGSTGNFGDILEVTEKIISDIKDNTKDEDVLCCKQLFQELYDLKQHVPKDKRFECALNILFILLYILDTLPVERKKIVEELCSEPNSQKPSNTTKHKLENPECLISLQNLKVIDSCFRFIAYTIYYACLDEHASVYQKIIIIKKKILFGGSINKVDSSYAHKVLVILVKKFLIVLKHPSVGEMLFRNYTPEFLVGILQLGFSAECSLYPEDTKNFRQELDTVLRTFNNLQILKGILLIKGVTTIEKKQSWIGSVSQSLFIRYFLLRENGVQLTIEASILIGSVSSMKQKEAVASLIAFAKAKEESTLFASIGLQIYKLFEVSKKDQNIIQILVFIIEKLIERNIQLSEKYVFKYFLGSLLDITSLKLSRSHASSEETLITSVENLHLLYVETSPVHEKVSVMIKPALCSIFTISCLPSTCHVKSKAQEIVKRYLSYLHDDEAVSILLILAGIEKSEDILPVLPDIKLIPKINELTIQEESSSAECIHNNEGKVQCLLALLKSVDSDYVFSEFIKKLTFCLDFTILNNEEEKTNCLYVEEDIINLKLCKMQKLLLVVDFLGSISENESTSFKIFSDSSSAVSIIKTFLGTHKQMCKDTELARIKDSFLMNCIMLVSSYLNEGLYSGRLKANDWNSFMEVVPVLKELLADSKYESLNIFTEQLVQLILTHGVIKTKFDVQKQKLTNESEEESQSFSVKSRVKVNKSSPTMSKYQSSILELCSPHVPVRGHALISLTKLLAKGDEEALDNHQKILALFQHYLADQDSYIYLMCIEGLTELTAKFPDKVLIILIEEFNEGKLTLEVRLKLVEVLTKAARCLGPLLPKYKSLFFNCLINGVKDDDPLIRAACFSNLGEVCKELHFSIESVIYEIFSLVENAVEWDKSPEVRRSSVLLVTLLLRGLGNNSLKVLQEVILNIYRKLKKLILTEKDETLVLHAELAMEEINAVTKEFLMPKLNLSKKIFVTEVPSDFL